MSIVRATTVTTSVDTSLRPKDISNEILKVRPEKKKVLVMLTAMGKITVDDYEFQNNQQGIDPGSVTVQSIVNAGNKTVQLNADDVKAVRVNQTWRLSHAFAFKVTAVDYDTAVVTLNTVTGLNADGGDIIALGAAAFSELSARPTNVNRTPTVGVNYVHTLRDSTAESRHAENVKFFGGPRSFHDRETMLYEHGRFIDRELLLGEREKTTYGGQVIYRTGGLLYQIQSNIREFDGGRLSYYKAVDLVAADTRLSQSDTLWLLCSNKGAALWTKLVYEKHIPTTVNEVFGINVTKIQLGSKFLKLYPVDHLNDSTPLEKTMIVVDPAFVEIVTTQNQTTKQRQWMLESKVEGRKTDGTDGNTTEVLTDFGLRLQNEQAHSIWWGVDDVQL
ncbi:MAG: hypothetical protein HZC54_00735 [Verrucomicrobia bacterium]|nr:hypothetical protein [Verrucomicrobiota bacterium]